jgi:DNA-binding GntR family transcriptional regulator
MAERDIANRFMRASNDPSDLPRIIGPTAGQEAARYIKRLIFDGALLPGSRIPQNELADALGVSRLPIREALVALEREGVVTIVPHRGAYVSAFDADAVRDHYELFGLNYGFAAQRTAERATPQIIAQLASLQKDLARATDPDEVLRFTGKFNNTILIVGGSPRLRAILGTLTGLLPGNFFAAVPAAIPTEQRGSSEILKAIRRSDPQGAFEACRAMMRAHGVHALHYLEERGLFRADTVPEVPRGRDETLSR